ncbi:MAG: hypothetical protein ACRD6I_19235, partial [Candidatus Acidiferrales bacterium]
ELLVNGRSYAIIGVGPKGFTGTKVGAAPEIWFPIAMQASIEPGINLLEARADSVFFLLARIKPGISLAQVQANLDSLAQSLALEFPEENKGMRLTLVKAGLAGFAPFRGAMIGFAALLLAVAALVLLLACANLSNMLLARATERLEETAISPRYGRQPRPSGAAVAHGKHAARTWRRLAGNVAGALAAALQPANAAAC